MAPLPRNGSISSNSALRLRQLGDRLDDDLRAGHGLVERRAAPDRLRELLGRPGRVDLVRLAQRLQRGGHQPRGLRERLGPAVGQPHAVAAEREHERDAMPHDAGAEDGDLGHASPPPGEWRVASGEWCRSSFHSPFAIRLSYGFSTAFKNPVTAAVAACVASGSWPTRGPRRTHSSL